MLYQELESANKLEVYSVCVRPAHVSRTVEHLDKINSNVKVGTVIGFPHGSQTHATKLEEISQASADGAVEVDIVVDIGKVKDAVNNKKIAAELKRELKEQVAKALSEDVEITKLILETAYLTPEEIRFVSKLGSEAGFDFLKTSTGFAHEGATVFNLLIMKSAAKPGTSLKASGGVSDLKTLLKMREFGIARFGTSKSEHILSQVGLDLDEIEEISDDY
jgi:deoxyribose-phosphate aldolase